MLVSINIVLATVFTVTLARSLRESTGSIMDHINIEEVQRQIKQRGKSLHSTEFSLTNELSDDDADQSGGGEANPDFLKQKYLKEQAALLFPHRFNRTAEIDPLQLTPKVLRSSKSALQVTQKDYLKKDWCKTAPLHQKIKSHRCIPVTIINRFCYGQCNSFYIPKNAKKTLKKLSAADVEEDVETDLAGAAFKSCSVCKPRKYMWITVTQRCPDAMPALRRKRVQVVKQCKCSAETSGP